MSLKGYKSHKASVVDVIAVGICIVAMTIIMIAYLGSSWLIDCKVQISQTARKYILRMETVGYLTGNDQLSLVNELEAIGALQIDLSGSTVNEVPYGSPIYLVIRGKLKGQRMDMGGDLFQTIFGMVEYDFEEHKMSTAKN